MSRSNPPTTSTSKQYSFTIRPTAPDTPSALRSIQKRLLDLADQTSDELELPISRKRVRYIDSQSEDTMEQRRVAQTINDRFEILEKVSSHRFLSQSWYIFHSNMQQGLKETLAFMDRIINGEIINAAFALFGHTPRRSSPRQSSTAESSDSSLLCSPGQGSANQISTSRLSVAC